MLGCELLLNGCGDDASGIKFRVGAHHSLDSLEVSNSRSVCAANERFAVGCETSINHRDHFVPVVGNPLVSTFTCFKLTTLDGGEEPAGELGLKILDKVDDRVNRPSGIGVSSVVAKADAKHAKDAAGLAVLNAIFFPNGHRTKRKRCLEGGEAFKALTIIFILEVSVTQKSANTSSASIKVEISELTGHLILKSLKNNY